MVGKSGRTVWLISHCIAQVSPPASLSSCCPALYPSPSFLLHFPPPSPPPPSLFFTRHPSLLTPLAHGLVSKLLAIYTVCCVMSPTNQIPSTRYWRFHDSHISPDLQTWQISCFSNPPMGADTAIFVSQSSHELRKAAVFSTQVLDMKVNLSLHLLFLCPNRVCSTHLTFTFLYVLHCLKGTLPQPKK